MPQVISDKNLARGIRYWCAEKPNWPRDFHRQFYCDLAVPREDGITERWWRGVLPHLRGWRAIRPLRTETILNRGLDRLEVLESKYEALKERIGASAPDFATLRWDDVAELYAVAHSIKGTARPVFGSKLCHFLVPGAFPVIDGDAVGLRGYDYSGYWCWCQEMWEACKEKEALISQLRDTISGNVGDEYPWGPKITEICLIGQRAT